MRKYVDQSDTAGPALRLTDTVTVAEPPAGIDPPTGETVTPESLPGGATLNDAGPDPLLTTVTAFCVSPGAK